jgi:DUF4097 and DUF4098 domain-containing protein YvlB
MYAQTVPPYAPPTKRSPWGWIIAFLAMGLFAVIVVAVMFMARVGRRIGGPPGGGQVTSQIQAGETALSDATADQVVSSGSETTLTKTFPLAESARFSIKNINGSITVGAWDQPKAEVKLIRRGSDPGTQVFFNNNGGNLAIRTAQVRGNQDVRYEIRLPRKLGRIELSSTNGSIKLSDVNGQIVVESVNGNIDLTDVVGLSKVQTTNARITGVLEEAANGPMEFTTVNGKIDLTLKSDFNANLEVTTVHGGVDIDEEFGIEVQKEIVGRRARGQIGNGGQTLRLTTVNGSVKLTKQ